MSQKLRPQYYRIYEALKGKIAVGTLPPGGQLPFERELCEQYSAQRITVRHALDLLVREGLIVKRPGVGSFVADPALPGEKPGSCHGVSPDARNTVLFVMMRNNNDVRNNSNAYNSQLFFIMERACRAHGLSLLFLPVGDASELRQRVESEPPVCALLVSHTAPELCEYLLRASIPALVINALDGRVISILPENLAGTYKAMDVLFSLGHSRIAFIGGMEHYVNAKERYLAYRVAHWTRGLAPDETLVMHGDWTFESGRHGMEALLALPAADRPTAVFCASDMMAIGTYEAIQSAGLAVGVDVSVIGFDNVPMCGYVLPHLSTMGVSLEQMTRVTMEHILIAIRGEPNASAPYAVRIPAEFIERPSLGPNKEL